MRIAAIALACLTMSTAGALPVDLPPAGPAPALRLPVHTERTLENGFTTTLLPYGSVPKTTLILTIDTGNIADGDHPGLADLTADLLKEGAGDRNSAALARRVSDLGGALGVSASAQTFTISLDVLAEHAADAIDIMADVVRRPRLPGGELSRLKADMKRSLAVARSRQQTLAGEAFAHWLWSGALYGRPAPTDAQVDAVTITDITAFVAREFGAQRTRLYVAGRFDEAAVDAAVRRNFSDWSRGPVARWEDAAPRTAPVVQLIDRPGAQQSTILMGLPVAAISTPDAIPQSIANAVLGGTPLLSRLDADLREQKGYTYGVQSSITSYRGGSVFSLATDVNTNDTAAAITEIYAQLERLRTEPVGIDELSRIQNFRAGTFLLGISSRTGLLGQLTFLHQQDLPYAWLENHIAHMNEATPDSVLGAARTLDPAKMTLIVVGDLSKIRAGITQLKALQGTDIR
jgi:zinc protease